jgi:hypothetical protein
MAKRFQINPIERQFQWGEMQIIELGQKGRGRKYFLMPYHASKDAELIEFGRTKTDKEKIVSSDKENGWIAIISAKGPYTRGTSGNVYIQEKDKDRVKIHGIGVCAWGDAGRIGGYKEYLVEIEDETWVMVKPAGGYKVSNYYLYFGSDHVDRVEEEELDLYCEHNGVEMPENFVDIEGGQ